MHHYFAPDSNEITQLELGCFFFENHSYDGLSDWLVHWRVCGSLVIMVENWSYGLGLFRIMLQKLPYLICNYVTKFDAIY
jgi:hypothetical protein